MDGHMKKAFLAGGISSLWVLAPSVAHAAGETMLPYEAPVAWLATTLCGAACAACAARFISDYASRSENAESEICTKCEDEPFEGQHRAKGQAMYSLKQIIEERVAQEVHPETSSEAPKEEDADEFKDEFLVDPFEQLDREREEKKCTITGVHTAIEIDLPLHAEKEEPSQEATSQEATSSAENTADLSKAQETLDAYDSEDKSEESNPYSVQIDYESLATEYVARTRFKDRMLSRAKGVQQVLSERLNPERAMEGVPLIKRANPSTAEQDAFEEYNGERLEDSGTRNTHKRQLEGVPMIQRGSVHVSLEAAFTDAPYLQEDASHGQDRFMADEELRTPQRSEIASRTADPTSAAPSEDAYKALRAQNDSWLAALDALDDQYEELALQPAPIFTDIVGEIGTLDEPDGLEEETNFLNFRVPAGHPEVQDTNSYIDFLVFDEMSAKDKRQGKRARSYLKLIKGQRKKAL